MPNRLEKIETLYLYIPGRGPAGVDVTVSELRKSDAELVRAAEDLQRALQQKEPTL